MKVSKGLATTRISLGVVQKPELLKGSSTDSVRLRLPN